MSKSKRLKISRGYKRFIRSEKARIKREVFDVDEQKKLIGELYARFVNE